MVSEEAGEEEEDLELPWAIAHGQACQEAGDGLCHMDMVIHIIIQHTILTMDIHAIRGGGNVWHGMGMEKRLWIWLSSIL